MDKRKLLISTTAKYLEKLFNIEFFEEHEKYGILDGYSSHANIAFIVLEKGDRDYMKDYIRASECTERDRDMFRSLDREGIKLLFIHYETEFDDLYKNIDSQLAWYANRQKN